MATRLAALSLAVVLGAPPVRAQCASFTGEFGFHGFDGYVAASALFDDGSGPGLYAVGDFDEVAGSPASSIARWDGSTWSAVGGGLDGIGSAVAVFDDGSGPALFVAGSFNSAGGVRAPHLARWDGSTWSAVTSGLSGSAAFPRALAVYDDGSGAALYLGGDFNAVSGIEVAHLARWDGAEWTPVGGADDTVWSLLAHDDGSGPALYAAGRFANVGGAASQGIARFDASGWTGLVGGAAVTYASALGALDDGRLVATAYFDGSPATATWSGGAWVPMAGSDSLWLQDFVIFGGATHACGYGLYEWTGATWVERASVESSQLATTLSVFDGGAGEALYVGGDFIEMGSLVLNRMARYDGAQLSAAGEPGAATNGGTNCFFVGSVAGSTPRLFAGGRFTTAGTALVNHIADWDGSAWSEVGGGVSGSWPPPEVRAIEIFDDGAGPALFAGGWFNAARSKIALSIARWNGTAWSSPGFVNGGPVNALATWDDGGGLFVAGGFTHIQGTAYPSIARYDGAWSVLGTGLAGGAAEAHALVVFDDGGGPALFVGGDFTLAGGVTVSGVARWDGAAWSDVGGGVAGHVSALAVFDDGSGPALYVGGDFVAAGGVGAPHFARWDGAAWSAPAGGAPDGPVRALAEHDDLAGGGPALFVGGEFAQVGRYQVNHLARWSGDWSAVDGGADGPVRALASYRGDLYVGGDFEVAGGEIAGHVARLSDPCACAATNYCTAGTTTNGCRAILSASGAASASAASGFDLLVSNVEGSRQGLIYFGTSGAKATPWGAGGTSYACVRAPHQRTPAQFSGGNAGQCDGSFALDFNAWMTANPGKAPAAGQTTWLQAWFRDPPAPKTTAFSDAVRFAVCP